MKTIHNLDSKTLSATHVGLKAYNFSKISNSVLYKKPKGFVISNKVLDLFIKENDLSLKSNNFVKAFEKAIFSQEMRKMILDEFDKCKFKTVAVRSSSNSEDMAGSSSAGVFHTELGVGRGKLLESVKKVWVSSFKVNKKNKMSVIVQEMIDADISGVLFTNNSLGNTSIEAVHGLCDILVSGLITPEYVSLNKDGSFFNSVMNKQDFKYVVKNQSIKKIKIPKDKVRLSKLTFDNIEKLSKASKKISKSKSRDIEWAIKDGVLYILQSRPAKKILEQKRLISKNVERHNSFALLQESKVAFSKLWKKFNLPKATEDVDLYDDKKGRIVYYSLSVEYSLIIDKFVDLLSKKNNSFKVNMLKGVEKNINVLKCFLKDTKLKNVSKAELKKAIEMFGQLYADIFLLKVLKYDADKFKKPINPTDRVRVLTDGLSDEIINVCMRYLESKDKKYLKLFPLLSKKELLSISTAGISKSDEQKILKRYALYKDKFFTKKELSDYLKKTKTELYEHIPKIKNNKIKGSGVFGGKVKGRVFVIKNKNDYKKFPSGSILVAHMTNIDMLDLMKKSKGIITDEGGALCHAAIHARELKKPCIVATSISTRKLKNGMEVSMDCKNGVVDLKSC